VETQNQAGYGQAQGFVEARQHPRFKLDVEIRILSRTSGVLMGRTVDLSESGLAAMLKIEVPIGEVVRLEFTVPLGPVSVHASVRQRNAFRYGFQFVESDAALELIRRTCRDLAVEQSFEFPQPPSR
jgi:hypothetical protein